MKKNVFIILIACAVIVTFGCSRFSQPEASYQGTTNHLSANIIEYLGHIYSITRGPLSVAQAREVFADTSLSATHKALCVYPKNMDQLRRLEADQLLDIFYHPFEYVLLPEKVKEADSKVNSIPQEPPLLGECSEVEVSSSDTPVMYPIYILWPIGHPIPDDFDYDDLFDVYRKSISDIKNEQRNNPGELPHISGHLKSYDNRLGEYRPIGNVQIEYYEDLGMPRLSYTDENGYFCLYCADSNYPMAVNLINDKFAIRDSLTSNVKSIAFDINDFYYENLNQDVGVYFPTDFYFDTYKAAAYYFFEQNNDLLNSVPLYDTLSVSIDIHAINEPGDYLGCFYPTATPYIIIWNYYKANYIGASSKIFGTVNHELAHATHYAYGTQFGVTGINAMIKESFASFMGWYNVLDYYSSFIGANQYVTNNICSQGRQYWTPSISMTYRNYTPIYIDLFDDYNQHQMLSSSYNDDPISGVSVPFIVSSALGPQTLQGVYNALLSGVDIHYSLSDFSTFISPYSDFLP